MEPPLIADPARPLPSHAAAESAAPIFQPLENSFFVPQASTGNLRAALADAIQARRVADDAVRAAGNIAARADAALRDASVEVERLAAARDAELREATQALAQRLTAAFREGETLQGVTVLPKADTAALAAIAEGVSSAAITAT